MGQLPRIDAGKKTGRTFRNLMRGLVFFLFAGIPGALGALDLRVAGGAGNTFFDPERTSTLGSTGSRFEPFLSPFGLVSVEGEYSDVVDYRASFDRDPVLGNRILANMGFNFSFLKLEIGPFAGLFNTENRVIRPGVTAALEIDYPGILFGSLKGSSTIGSPVLFSGDFIQETGDLAFGFWVPHVICTFSINHKSFTERKSDELLVKDELTRYQFRADVFTKNVPYTIRIDMGYQSLKRLYAPAGGGSDTDEFKSVFAGFEGTYRVLPSLQLILGMEMPVYFWGEKPLKGPERPVFMYQFHAGFVWTLPAKK
jgi:hypothetical protein